MSTIISIPSTYIRTTITPSNPRSSQTFSQTSSSSPSSSSPSSATSTSNSNRILSAFNPTSIYYIPSHGGLTPTKPAIPIIDLTSKLKLKSPESPEVGTKEFKREIKAIVHNFKAKAKASAKANNGFMEQDTVLYSRKFSRMSSKSSIEVPIRMEDGTVTGRNQEGRRVAEWRVPWDLFKPATVTFLEGRKKRVVEVEVGDYDTRAQQFMVDNARYVWRFTKHNELSLEKEMPGYKHLVAIFYLKGFFTTTSGTLLVDERGVDRVLAVSTILICLKRERQRRSVLFSTD